VLESWQRQDIFLSPNRPDMLWGPHSLWGPHRLWGPYKLLSMDTNVLPRGESSRDVKFTTFLHLVTGLRMSGAIPLFPFTSSRRGQGQLQPLCTPTVVALPLFFTSLIFYVRHFFLFLLSSFRFLSFPVLQIYRIKMHCVPPYFSLFSTYGIM
jgi:hypothetical protein